MKRTAETKDEVKCCDSPNLRQCGWDVWAGGEETQYICDSCGRFVCHIIATQGERGKDNVMEYTVTVTDYWTWSEHPMDDDEYWWC